MSFEDMNTTPPSQPPPSPPKKSHLKNYFKISKQVVWSLRYSLQLKNIISHLWSPLTPQNFKSVIIQLAQNLLFQQIDVLVKPFSGHLHANENNAMTN